MVKPFKPGPPGIKLKGGDLEKLRKGEAVKQQLSAGSGGRGLVIQVCRHAGDRSIGSHGWMIVVYTSLIQSRPPPTNNYRTCTPRPRWCGAASWTSPPTRAWCHGSPFARTTRPRSTSSRSVPFFRSKRSMCVFYPLTDPKSLPDMTTEEHVSLSPTDQPESPPSHFNRA